MAENKHSDALNNNKPALSEDQAVQLIESLYGVKVLNIKPLPSYDDQNFYIKSCSEDPNGCCEYVMKITNSEDSRYGELLEAQTSVMVFLCSNGVPAQKPVFTKNGQSLSLETIDYGSTIQKQAVRLLTYLPGTPLARVVATPEILFDIGKMAANIDKMLAENFLHPNKTCFERGQFIWNLSNTSLLRKYAHAVKETELQKIIEDVITQYETFVLPNLNCFRKCINHGDLNDHNILVEKTSSPGSIQEQYKVSGILDFSDMSFGYYIFELAITIMYMMIESNDPLHAGGYVLAGFQSVIPLTDEEKDALFFLVNCRFSQSLVMARYSVQLCPENEEYLMITAKTGWKHLQTLHDMGKEAVEKIWFETADSYVATH
ncbi:hydroxylysine kinase isoform X1 [Xenopus laevis]|uniref:Hydroxylysine kinase n=2 Tax=Xenopus laevis TaxID=8355 RepID=A0A974DDN8_XENLA|nr:hydroxylysine kinase isoform X1 [Xenopus laevis]OCT89485.1 hypothetical protein XELAEV_18018106mg [Xenopus laevis]